MKILLIAVVLLIIGLFIYQETKRSGALKQVASEAGFSFTKGQLRLPDWLEKADFYLFSQGQPQVKNLMQGQRGGYQLAVMGYFYDAPEGGAGSRELGQMDTDHIMENRGQTVVWLGLGSRQLPDFDLSPRDLPKRYAAQHAQYQGMTFDGADAFRKQTMLLGRDRDALSSLFDDATIQRWLSQHSDWVVESHGDSLLCYVPKQRLAEDRTMSFVDECISLTKHLTSKS